MGLWFSLSGFISANWSGCYSNEHVSSTKIAFNLDILDIVVL